MKMSMILQKIDSVFHLEREEKKREVVISIFVCEREKEVCVILFVGVCECVCFTMES